MSPAVGRTRCRHARRRAGQVPATSFAALPSPTTIGTPRERASIATWLAELPFVSAMPPPADQSVARKRVGAMSSPNRIAPGGALPVSGGGQRVEHLLADILQVGGPRPEIFVVGCLVAGDLARPAHRTTPCRPARPSAIASKAGPESASSASMASWNSSMSAASPVDARGQRRELLRGRRDGGLQRCASPLPPNPLGHSWRRRPSRQKIGPSA